MKTALVTGGAGFLGSHIAEELSNRGYRVSVLDRDTSPWLREDQRMVVGDILSKEDVERAIQSAVRRFCDAL